MVKQKKADKIWAYKIKHPKATAKQIAKATKSSEAYVFMLMKKIGTPKEVLEAPKEDQLDLPLKDTNGFENGPTIRKAPEGATLFGHRPFYRRWMISTPSVRIRLRRSWNLAS